ncbi:MAG: DUF4254 domain-containing protein [Gemmatimonadaceae bacterium]
MIDESVGQLVARLAQTNIELWHEEDSAREPDDHVVASAKRRIDRLNQQRNNIIEQIDERVMEIVRTHGGEATGPADAAASSESEAPRDG